MPVAAALRNHDVIHAMGMQPAIVLEDGTDRHGPTAIAPLTA
jgi:hypothetical protein